MSDVPATAWWLVALVFATSTENWKAFVAGCATSAAVLTRPNLVPLAAVIGLIVLVLRPKTSRAVLFVAGVIPGCLIVGVLNWSLYGSPLASGYGTLESICAWNRLGANLERYPAWLLQVQSAAVVLAFAAPFMSRRSSEPGAAEGVRPSCDSCFPRFRCSSF